MILITGNTGFIGSHLVPLIKRKYKNESIFCLDKPKYDLVTGKNLDKIPKKPKLIIHLAAETDTSKPDHSANDIGTKNLISALKGLGPKTHFIYTSSQAVFSGRVNCKRPIDERVPPFPNNRYGKTKLEAERTLLEASKIRGFKLTIVRLPTTWGDNPRKNSFLNFLKSLVKSNSIISRLNWPGKIGLMYVDDAAKFILNEAARRPFKPKIISVAVENLTLAEIFESLTRQSGKDYKQIKIPNFVWNTARLLRPHLAYFKWILPAGFYNYFWRASIVVDNPLWCKVNVKGIKFTS